MEHVFLIDGSGFIFRAFYGIKAEMTRSDGTPTNAVYGFTQMLLKMAGDTDADHIAVVFDRARKTFRSDIYPEYKAHRPPPPDDLIPQFDLVREATEAMNISMVDMDGFEADDLIATYARQAVEAGADVTVVSSDKDLMQIVGPKVKMLDAMKNQEIGPDQVREKFGVGPERVIDVQALAGDSSDNVPGVQGIGVKTAAGLIEEFGDLDGILSRAEEIKQPKRRQVLIEQADLARISRQLVTLRDDVPVEVPLQSFKVRDLDPEKLMAFLQAQDFKSLVTRIQSRYGINAPPPPPQETKAEPRKKPVADAKQVSGAAPADIFSGQAEYELVQDKARLKAWIAEAAEAGIVAVDTETTSLNAMRAELVGVSMSIKPGRACYIPVAHSAPEAQASLDLGLGEGDAPKAKDGIKQIKRDDAVKMLKPLLEDPTVLKIGHNVKYDAEIFAHYGVEVAPVDDTMLVSYVLEGGLHGHGMDDLAELHLGHQTIKFKEVAGSGKAQMTFDQVPLDKALDYAAEDADITCRLHRLLKPRLAREHMVSIYEVMERPLIGVLAAMERTGIRVEPRVLKDLSADFAGRLADLEVEIHRAAGHEFNIASPKQLGEILFDEMGLAGGKKGKTGAYGTGADVLEGLAADGHELPARVLDWRQLAKLKSTYTDTLVEQINPATGRVHTNYGQAIASTGRLSSNDPNLQNIPVRTEEGRKIRQAFVPDDGHLLLSADYSQIELRLLAHVADIEVLKDAFRDGADIHAITASQVFGVPAEGMDPMVRRQAKAINFGIIYGISAFGLARQLGIGRGEAAAYIDAYFERYPGIRAYMDQAKEQAREHGYVTTLYGRKCHAPGIEDKNSARRNFAERAAINAPIQGGAADIIKRAMIRLPGELAAAGLRAAMLLQVHDELIFEVPETELEATAELVKRIMESVAQLDVPLVVDTGHGANWDEAH
ncbi:MAG: DNA polymerase I [Rhodospirillales bacterium]|jgi:DNA polymerase-1|nr:DNA polymerase I [Rhodospirillaceae bacterium]MDP6645806.1 DNA polymerase I [Rhodospirillales bacterium]MDP6843519.1 DNA polymerase I [Rhodospirillales bacterium]